MIKILLFLINERIVQCNQRFLSTTTKKETLSKDTDYNTCCEFCICCTSVLEEQDNLAQRLKIDLFYK